MAWNPDDSTASPPSSKGGRLRLRLLVAIGGVVLAGIALVVAYFALRTESSRSESFTQPISRIEIDVDNGRVDLRASTTGVVEVSRDVRYFFRAPEITQQVEGDTLIVRHRCPSLSLGPCSGEFELGVPAAVSVVAKTSNGSIEAAEIRGDLDLESSNGALRIRESYGRLELQTRNGAIEGDELRSLEVVGTTENGEVDLEFAAGPESVDASTDNGAVTVRVPGNDPYRVDATTQNGRTLIDVRNDPGASRTIRAASQNGAVTVAGR